MTELVALMNLVADLRLIERVRWKLARQSEPAAERLAGVLDELAKMFGALDDELIRYLSLSIGGESLVESRALLLGLEAGRSTVRLNEARGRCRVISNIYVRYLKRWFHDALAVDEAARLERLFTDLSTADSVMLAAMDEVATFLRKEAEDVLAMIDVDDLLGANDRVRSARLLLRDDRSRLTESMAQLRALESEFIAISGIA